MTKPTEQEIEHVARAMCEGLGGKPDDIVTMHPVDAEAPSTQEVHWKTYRYDALKFLAGHYAMKEWA